MAAAPARPRPTGSPLPGELEPLTGAELHEWFRGGEPLADECEATLASLARVRGATDVAIAEGLDLLRRGDRLAVLGCHLDDYAREVLDLGRRATEGLARLGRELRTRPLLRDALRAGRVRLRAAQTVLNVAVGDEEPAWVARAERMTVRELEAAVRAAGRPDEEDEPWLRLGVRMAPEDREVLDVALELAGELVPGGRVERLEAIAQEFAGTHPLDPDAAVDLSLRAGFRPVGIRREERRTALEAETGRWELLSRVGDFPSPDVSFDESDGAREVDRKLRRLSSLRARCDEVLAWCAVALRRSGLWRLLGYDGFRHYCAERLGLSARSVEERAKVEERRWASPALQEATRQGLPFEKLRLLARLPEGEIAAWIPRAHALTCVALRRALEGEAERQMRAQRRVATPLPLRVAVVVAAAVQAVRERTGLPLPAGKCLAIVAAHFIRAWECAARPRKTLSREVRERGLGHCQVPGCSRRATHAHHVLYRSRGGGDELENQIGVCEFHHLRCIHGGWLRVVGRAPDELRWFLGGEPWEGPRRDRVT
ncbi:MAG TPA: HNH endonuclease signature motif containing protein [Anaeromyxobacter sp.]